jgi:hypothetical protein
MQGAEVKSDWADVFMGRTFLAAGLKISFRTERDQVHTGLRGYQLITVGDRRGPPLMPSRPSYVIGELVDLSHLPLSSGSILYLDFPDRLKDEVTEMLESLSFDYVIKTGRSAAGNRDMRRTCKTLISRLYFSLLKAACETFARSRSSVYLSGHDILSERYYRVDGFQSGIANLNAKLGPCFIMPMSARAHIMNFIVDRSEFEIKIAAALVNVTAGDKQGLFEIWDSKGTSLGIRKVSLGSKILALAHSVPAPTGLRMMGAHIQWSVPDVVEIVTYLLDRAGAPLPRASVHVVLKEGKFGDLLQPTINIPGAQELALLDKYAGGLTVTWGGGSHSAYITFSISERPGMEVLDVPDGDTFDRLQPESEPGRGTG